MARPDPLEYLVPLLENFNKLNAAIDKLISVVREDLDVAELLSFSINAQGQVVDP